MRITLHRTRADDPERDAELRRTLDVGALHALLHAQGEADLAAALLLRLTPEGARDLAGLLARFRRRWTRPGLFRPYRRLLDAEGARHVDLAVAFLRGAGHAGCRVYPDPDDDVDDRPAHPGRLRVLPSGGGDEGAAGLALAPVAPRDEEGTLGTRRRIMPPWLPRPHDSAWDR